MRLWIWKEMNSSDHLSPVAARGCLSFRLQQSAESPPEPRDVVLLCQLQMLTEVYRDWRNHGFKVWHCRQVY